MSLSDHIFLNGKFLARSLRHFIGVPRNLANDDIIVPHYERLALVSIQLRCLFLRYVFLFNTLRIRFSYRFLL